MTLFYLIRHGKKEVTSGDVPLSPSGLRQAYATAQFLQERPIQQVYSSPLRRAKETAACIASVHARTVIEDVRLRERANWGDMPGQSLAEFVAMWERSTHDPEYLPPVGDSARQAGARMEQFLREVAHRYPAEELAVVTHGGLITDFLVLALPVEQLEQWHPAFLVVQSSLIPECSITVLRFEREQYLLECLAEVKHLPERGERLSN